MQRISQCLILLLMLASVGCHQNDNRTLPHDLVGHWTTDTDGYKGRFLEISQAFVVVGTGQEATPRVQMIERIETERNGDETTYTIHSTSTDGISDLLTIRFTPRNGGELRLKNRPAVLWKKQQST